MSGVCASADEFRRLFLDDVPFLDVRAEVEFDKGAFPTSCNQPILNTEERQQVGSCYKQRGQDIAIELGHRLVSGELKQQRIDNWCRFAKANPSAHLYCWRGGMRSNLAQQWMQSAGVDIPLIAGGYKALRRVLIDEIRSAANGQLVIIGGKTGTAKTPLINALATGIDLEGFAHHRGSSFGRRVTAPPCQVNFENNLAIGLLKTRAAYPGQLLVLEDESRMVGPISLPLELWQAMENAPLVVVEMPLAFRVQRILQEYVIEMAAEYLAADSTNGFDQYRHYLLASLARIKKRLGSQRYTALVASMTRAIDRQQACGDVAAHEEWIQILLEEYYDPMYQYQLQTKQQRVVFAGDYQQVLQWVGERLASSHHDGVNI
jgi:tRNA 2-selenouridine synthase